MATLSTPRKRRRVTTIGRVEWVGLPDLGIDRIKAKVDTGAATSALHALRIRQVTRDGLIFVQFEVHPVQRSRREIIRAEAELRDERYVRSSNGQRELRPVIRTRFSLMGRRWSAELTLAGRSLMTYRMILGRSAISRRFLVDVSRTFEGGRPG